MRVKVSREVVRDYTEKLGRGQALPAVVLFVDHQERYWPGDGWHRLSAHDTLALPDIEADVRPGGRRAAFLFALGANNEHGLRRTQADKKKAVLSALGDEELRQQSDREIAQLVGVDHKTVGKMRKALEQEQGGSLLDAFRRGRDGKVRRMPVRKTDGVGISPVPNFLAAYSPRAGTGGVGFNIVEEMARLNQDLAHRLGRWPEDKRHSFCVALMNFAKEQDPEVRTMKADAFAEVLAKAQAGEKPSVEVKGG